MYKPVITTRKAGFISGLVLAGLALPQINDPSSSLTCSQGCPLTGGYSKYIISLAFTWQMIS